MLDAAIFNLIIGNADAHAKNFSLLHRDGVITMAPLYDLLATFIYPELSPRMAMKIGGKAVLQELELRHWDKFSADAELGGPFVRTRIKQLCGLAKDAIDREFASGVFASASFAPIKAAVAERALLMAIKYR